MWLDLVNVAVALVCASLVLFLVFAWRCLPRFGPDDDPGADIGTDPAETQAADLERR